MNLKLFDVITKLEVIRETTLGLKIPDKIEQAAEYVHQLEELLHKGHVQAQQVAKYLRETGFFADPTDDEAEKKSAALRSGCEEDCKVLRMVGAGGAGDVGSGKLAIILLVLDLVTLILKKRQAA